MMPENHIKLVLLTGVSRKTALKMLKISKFDVRAHYEHLCSLIKDLEMKSGPTFARQPLDIAMIMSENHIKFVPLTWISR